MVLLLLFSVTFAAVAGDKTCGSVVPAIPGSYHAYVKSVLKYLVKKAPRNSAFSYVSWWPDRYPGSVQAAAVCYTRNSATCSRCLESLEANLKQCTKSTVGADYGRECNMQFWLVGSIE
ncbi:hypothetical protein LINPERPRIM_LOCUS31996 [Linum perenne]